MWAINLLGISLIFGIVWWFWLYKPKEVLGGSDIINVVVENGTYQPARIKITSGQATILAFLRRDASPCASTVMFPDIEVSEELPLHIKKDIKLPPMSPGKYTFTCQMQMYRGELIVE